MAGMMNLLGGQTYDGSRGGEWGQRQRVAAAGLSDDIWTLEEIVMMADNYLPQPAKRGPYRKEERRLMGLISRAIDKIVDPLPTWAKGVLGSLIVVGFIYGIIREGFWFLLRVLFAPDF
jgi:hypothetical protein